jgi:hypothetical protein
MYEYSTVHVMQKWYKVVQTGWLSEPLVPRKVIPPELHLALYVALG